METAERYVSFSFYIPFVLSLDCVVLYIAVFSIRADVKDEVKDSEASPSRIFGESKEKADRN